MELNGTKSLQTSVSRKLEGFGYSYLEAKFTAPGRNLTAPRHRLLV